MDERWFPEGEKCNHKTEIKDIVQPSGETAVTTKHSIRNPRSKALEPTRSGMVGVRGLTVYYYKSRKSGYLYIVLNGDSVHGRDSMH